jgi:hypothetical protein
MHELPVNSAGTRSDVLPGEVFPARWRDLIIHESSPILGRGPSRRLVAEVAGYLPSHYYPNVPPGEDVNGVRSENLEKLSFPGESIDLHLTSISLILPRPSGKLREGFDRVAPMSSRPLLKTNGLWASVREVFNIFQAADCGCHIVTVSHDILAKAIKLGGMDLGEPSLDTVRTFYADATAASFKL